MTARTFTPYTAGPAANRTNGLTRLAARKDAIGRTRESFTHTFDGLPASRADACGNLATNVWDASHTRLLQRSTFDVQRSLPPPTATTSPATSSPTPSATSPRPTQLFTLRY
ncbi:MAG: hypothetical protein ACOX7Q_06700 [Kiritimatiellia bacterium]|jgi:hypothetical protein